MGLCRRSSAGTGRSAAAYRREFGTPSDWTGLTASVEDDALQIRGRCPVCRGTVDDFVSLSPAWAAALRRTGGTDVIETVTVCNCEEKHADAPEGRSGCGAMAVLRVELRGGAGGIEAAVLTARAATARDRSWDDEAARWEHERAERVGTTAERWAGTIGALFGVVGFGLVLQGDRVAEVVGSDAEWPWWVLGGLFATAFAASLYGWRRHDTDEPQDDLLIVACAASFVAALVAFAWGGIEGVPLDGGTTFGVLAGVSVAFGLAATGFAGFAAQGSPKWVNYLTGNRARRLRMESADRSMRNLRRARLATIVAVTGLVATLAVYWYADVPGPTPQQVVVSTTDGAEECGRLLPYGGRGVRFDPAGDEESRIVSRAELKGVGVVPTCP